MGRWSYDIIAGDTALDAQSDIYDLCGIEQYPEDTDEENILPAATLTEKQAEIIAHFGPLLKDDEQDYYEYLLVLGYMMAQAGAVMYEETRQAILQAIERQESFWYDFRDRLKVLKKFKATITAYDNQAVPLSSTTLFEAIVKKSKSLVINKDEPRNAKRN